MRHPSYHVIEKNWLYWIVEADLTFGIQNIMNTKIKYEDCRIFITRVSLSEIITSSLWALVLQHLCYEFSCFNTFIMGPYASAFLLWVSVLQKFCCGPSFFNIVAVDLRNLDYINLFIFIFFSSFFILSYFHLGFSLPLRDQWSYPTVEIFS